MTKQSARNPFDLNTGRGLRSEPGVPVFVFDLDRHDPSEFDEEQEALDEFRAAFWPTAVALSLVAAIAIAIVAAIWWSRPAEGRASDRTPVAVDRPAGAPAAREAEK